MDRLTGIVRHVKRGTSYDIVGYAEMQGTAHEGEYFAVYQGQDGKIWVRPEEEFNDGRFVGGLLI